MKHQHALSRTPASAVLSLAISLSLCACGSGESKPSEKASRGEKQASTGQGSGLNPGPGPYGNPYVNPYGGESLEPMTPYGGESLVPVTQAGPLDLVDSAGPISPSVSSEQSPSGGIPAFRFMKGQPVRFELNPHFKMPDLNHEFRSGDQAFVPDARLFHQELFRNDPKSGVPTQVQQQARALAYEARVVRNQLRPVAENAAPAPVLLENQGKEKAEDEVQDEPSEASIFEIMSALNVGNFQTREPQPSDVQYFDEALTEIEALGDTVEPQTKKNAKKIVVFLKSMLKNRNKFLIDAAKWQANASQGRTFGVWAWHCDSREVGNSIVFHQEDVSEAGGNKNFTMRARLNYIHNAWLKAFLLSREANQLPSFVSNPGIQSHENSIDAKTQFMLDTLMPQLDAHFEF